MTKRSRSEIRAGFFLNLGLALALLFLFLFGTSVSIFSRNNQYVFDLPNGEGLLPGTKVLLAGILAGKVDSLSIQSQTGHVQVKIDVKKKFQRYIRADSFVDLTSQGVLGDRVVMISVGTPRQEELSNGSELKTRNVAGFSQLIGQGNIILAHLDQLVTSLNEIISPLAKAKTGKKLSQQAVQTLSELSEVAHKLNQTLNSEDLSKTIASLNSILDKFNHGTGTIGELLNDPSVYNDLKALVGEVNRNRILRNLVRKAVTDEAKEPPSQQG